MPNLARLLRPRSVAIVGASDKPGALGASVLANLTRAGYAGPIHLINPRRAEIAGRACLPSVEALPEGIDVAVLAIPRAAVLETMRALAERRVGAAIIFSAGFAEGGEAGLAEQRAIAQIARDADMVVEGPNCLGLINFVDGVPLTFVELPATPLAGRPGIGIVSQSGAMAAVLGVTLMARDLGLSYSVSTGNEAASGVEDYVDHLVDDPDTRVIAMIVEQFRRPARFLAAAERARAAGKPVVLLHPGRGEAARRSAATHTGALAGDYAVMRLKVERAGVSVVGTLEELGDVAELLLRCPPFSAGGTAVLTESGAYKALTLDLAEDVGLALPPLGDADSPALRAALPDFVPVSNPVDLTAQALVDPDLYRRALAALLDDTRVAAVVLGIIQTDAATCALKFPPIIEALRALKPGKPVLFGGLDEGAAVAGEHIAALRALGVPYFATCERVIRALAVVARRGGAPAEAAPVPPLPPRFADDVRGVVPEYRAKALLAPLGIPFPESRMATTLAEAHEAAGQLGYPVVLKAQSAELSHKSDAGGVIVGLADPGDLARGWAQLAANIAHHRPGLVLDGVLVERMGARGVELIVGGRSDPDWGPVVLVGFGGVQAEVLKDVCLLPPDLDEAAIADRIRTLRSAALLDGFRGAPALDVAAVARVAAAVGRALLSETRIREIDLNPVVVRPVGEGAVALDALMIFAPP
ncbi:acetate--CoA ligase family protein [Methylobacterium sp. AMS5]|uniref:acetate--CoA ligase family protein n=1 Tax=Methylobacterium sp. AMS5 TaxID=925818 RepID=UPI00074F8C41|nr:acetate--CoA ligase family protein [Methylobacterium sp. AMS5]AMB47074.1 CoA-binding protein [Methylobacterium sp. AMS5]